MLFNEYIKNDSHLYELLGKDFIDANWNKLSILFTSGYIEGHKEATDISTQCFNQSFKQEWMK